MNDIMIEEKIALLVMGSLWAALGWFLWPPIGAVVIFLTLFCLVCG